LKKLKKSQYQKKNSKILLVFVIKLVSELKYYSILNPNKQHRHCKAVIFRVQSSRWTRNFIVLRVDLWRFLALSLDCTAQIAFAMTFGGVVHKTLFNFVTTLLRGAK